MRASAIRIIRVQEAARVTYVLCQKTPHLPLNPAPVVHRSRGPKLGIGGRLALGLAAVVAVIFIGRALVAETTGKAVEAIRSMQHDHEPLARRASTIVEKLVGFDRAVSEYMQASRDPDESAIVRSRDSLEQSLSAYFSSKPGPTITPSVSELRVNMIAHIARGKALADEAAQRADWVARRNARTRQHPEARRVCGWLWRSHRSGSGLRAPVTRRVVHCCHYAPRRHGPAGLRCARGKRVRRGIRAQPRASCRSRPGACGSI